MNVKLKNRGKETGQSSEVTEYEMKKCEEHWGKEKTQRKKMKKIKFEKNYIVWNVYNHKRKGKVLHLF